MRIAPTHNPPHSLQVGSHLPLQHRNSFCVSALSSTVSSSYYAAPQTYTSSNNYTAPDPFSFTTHRGPFEDLTSSEVRSLNNLISIIHHFFLFIAVVYKQIGHSESPIGSDGQWWSFRARCLRNGFESPTRVVMSQHDGTRS